MLSEPSEKDTLEMVLPQCKVHQQGVSEKPFVAPDHV